MSMEKINVNGVTQELPEATMERTYVPLDVQEGMGVRAVREATLGADGSITDNRGGWEVRFTTEEL